MRDHQLGYPPATMAAEPAPAAPRYPLGRPTRDPEPAPVWPFPLVKPAVTFVADSRTMDSDRPQPVVLGVDMGKPGGDETLIALRSGSVLNLYDATSWVSVSGGFTWDASSGALIAKPPEPEKPAQAEPQATPQPDAKGWTPYSGQRCPLPMGTRYECERANGRRSTYRVDSGDFDPGSFWNHAPDDSERNRASWLVRYRVLVDA